VGALSQFAEQPPILHRDDRLRSKILQQCDLLAGERSHLTALGNDNAEKTVVLSQGHHQHGSHAAVLEGGAGHRISREQRCELRQVSDVHEKLLAAHVHVRRIIRVQFVRLCRHHLRKTARSSLASQQSGKIRR
jgi:hypothetical protein